MTQKMSPSAEQASCLSTNQTSKNSLKDYEKLMKELQKQAQQLSQIDIVLHRQEQILQSVTTQLESMAAIQRDLTIMLSYTIRTAALSKNHGEWAQSIMEMYQPRRSDTPSNTSQSPEQYQNTETTTGSQNSQ